MLNSKFIKSIAIISTIGLMVSGCGNSSSNDSSLSSSKLGFNGKLVDSAIDGASYDCGNGKKLTHDGGLFGPCPFGSKVTFSIGNIVLGSVGATPDLIFTLNDVVDVPRDTKDNPTVAKIASLLQSLDSDNSHSTGIVITPAAIKALGTLELKDITDDAIKNVIIEVEKVEATGRKFVNTDEALANVAETLADVKSGGVTTPTQPTDQSTN